MKLRGFQSDALRLGFVDVKLVNTATLALVTCTECGCTSRQMYYAECGHINCHHCLFLLSDPDKDDKLDALVATCHRCQRDVNVMSFDIQETFILQLFGHCPRCNVVLSLRELRAHLSQCKTGMSPLTSAASSTASKAISAVEQDEIVSDLANESGFCSPTNEHTVRQRMEWHATSGSPLAASSDSPGKKFPDGLSVIRQARNEVLQEIKAMVEERNTGLQQWYSFHLALFQRIVVADTSTNIQLVTGDVDIQGTVVRFVVKHAAHNQYYLYMTVVATNQSTKRVCSVSACETTPGPKKCDVPLTRHDVRAGATVFLGDVFNGRPHEGTVLKVVFVTK